MELPRLYVIVDRTVAATQGCGDVIRASVEAANAGARFFQIREKELSDDELYEFVERVTVELAGYGATVLVNGRADIARAVGCDGVHRPQNGIPLTAVRRLVDQSIVGVSAHGAAELLDADEDGATFLTLSPVFETTSKPGAKTLGIDGLSAGVKLVDIPVYALGGITPARVPDCLKAGAHGVAVLSGIMAADDPYEATRAYLDAL